MSLIRVWTIHPVAAWESFQRTGELRGSAQHAEPYFRRAYEWLRGQMKKRLPSYVGGWPVWAWVRWSPESPRPDLRASGHLPHGTHGVRIELLVPEERVLISDYELWHMVLNDSYLSWSEAEDERWCARAESGGVTAEVLQREKEASWERIFDFSSPHRDPEWWNDYVTASLQAAVEVFRLNEVRDVTPFTAR